MSLLIVTTILILIGCILNLSVQAAYNVLYDCRSNRYFSCNFRCVIDTSPESALCKISDGINDADKLGGYIADQGLILIRAVFAELVLVSQI
jgi:hypothetical protein